METSLLQAIVITDPIMTTLERSSALPNVITTAIAKTKQIALAFRNTEEALNKRNVMLNAEDEIEPI